MTLPEWHDDWRKKPKVPWWKSTSPLLFVAMALGAVGTVVLWYFTGR